MNKKDVIQSKQGGNKIVAYIKEDRRFLKIQTKRFLAHSQGTNLELGLPDRTFIYYLKN